jgi:hypothetical protein
MEKRLLAIMILAIVASLSVAGCSSSTNSSSGGGGGGSSSNIALTINSQQVVSQIRGGSFSGTPQAGNVFLILNVTVTNLNENNWPLGNPLYFKLTTADNAVYSYSSLTYYLGASALTPVSNTNPGETVSGQIAFEIPQSATATTLTYNDGLGGSCSTNISSISSPSPTSTTTPISTSTPSPSATPSGHNPVLEQTVILSENNKNKLMGYTLESWNVIWHSDNSVTMLSTIITNGTNSTASDNETLIAFPTTQDATNYLNALDLNNYRLMSTTYNTSLPIAIYPIALGHDPQTFQEWSTPVPLNGPYYMIGQYDNILQFLSIS